MGSILTSRCHARRPKRKQRSPFNLHQKALRRGRIYQSDLARGRDAVFLLFPWIIVGASIDANAMGLVRVTTLRGGDGVRVHARMSRHAFLAVADRSG